MREVAAARSPAEQRTGPDVRTPEAWQGRKGDAKAEGTLSRVDCSGASLVFVVETDGESGDAALSLVAANPGAIRVNSGTAPREFSCGAGLKLRVSVEYVESTRELIAIEYR